MTWRMDPDFEAMARNIPGFTERRIDPVVERFLEAVPGLEGFLDVDRWLDALCAEDPRCVRLDSNEYKFRDYYFLTGIRFIQNANVLGMISANKKSLSYAPEVIDYRRLINGDNIALVTRIEGTESGNVVPLYKAMNLAPVEQRRATLSEIEALMRKYEYYHIATTERRNWFVVPATGRLILGNFSGARRCAVVEKQQTVLREIREALGL